MNNYYNHIEDYLSGLLNATDRAEFENQMKSDLSLAEAVKDFELAKKIAASLIEDETRQQLSKLKKQYRPNKFLKVIAVISALMLIGLIYYYTNNKKAEPVMEETQIFASLYEPPASQASRSDVELATTKDSAIFFFDKGDLNASLELFKLIEKHDTSDPTTIKYLGHIYLKQSEFKQSERYFNKLHESGSLIQQHEAEYNLIIINLIAKNYSEAKKYYYSLKPHHIVSESKMEMIGRYLKLHE
jgi:tetratricopeptide (TPR) repeat protein